MPSDAEADALLLGRLPLFRGVPDRVVERLLRRRHPVAYREGEVIFQEGDPASRLHVVLAGVVKIVRGRKDGREVLLDIVKCGETIAECAFCASEFHSFSAEAVTPCRLLGIDVDAISTCLREETAFGSVLLRVQQRHFELLMDQVEQMKLMTGAQRVGRFMLRHTEGGDGEVAFDLPYEKALIASLLGMNPETFSRVLAQLRKRGVRVEGRRVVIASVARLAQFVDRG
ncbi:Crp/Fnr family transcriptional regulator [Prosthecomicrobium sp. N25]|uniref:Crp/Fnr family transcriptional regulator n=1 Tax=Prosthecomicrobium sp. N25 TaxID=3129254 RepID=UPI0030772228